MGARQSVAQPARQDGVLSSGNVNNQGTNTTGHHSGSSHEASTSTGTSASAIGGGARPRLHLHSNSSPSSSNHRSSNRQSRSRSMATSSQMQADTAALIAALQQQRRRVNRLLTNAAMTTGSDLSSDSDDANDALMSTSTVRSLDRILRLNSNTDGETASSSSSNRVWLPPISFRCFGKLYFIVWSSRILNSNKMTNIKLVVLIIFMLNLHFWEKTSKWKFKWQSVKIPFFIKSSWKLQ